MEEFHHTEDDEILNKNQKPHRLMEQIVKMFSREGDTVLDACCGTGMYLRIK